MREEYEIKQTAFSSFLIRVRLKTLPVTGCDSTDPGEEIFWWQFGGLLGQGDQKACIFPVVLVGRIVSPPLLLLLFLHGDPTQAHDLGKNVNGADCSSPIPLPERGYAE